MLTAAFLGACNIQGGRSHYVLAERLFNDHKYAASVQEFRKVVDNDPKSQIAQQALFRIATIQYLYLGAYAEAVKSFRHFTFLSQDTNLVYEAEKNIGEILFSKTEDFRGALEQYSRLLGKYPDSPDRDFFTFRMAKSSYHNLKFDDAIRHYQALLKEFPHSSYAEESLYQIGNSYYTKGEYELAVEAFEEDLVRFPKGKYSLFAQFGIAVCYEELDQLDEAYAIYKRIKDVYPSKNIVELKLKRVQDRRAKRNR